VLAKELGLVLRMSVCCWALRDATKENTRVLDDAAGKVASLMQFTFAVDGYHHTA